MIINQRITVIKIRKPSQNDINENLRWLGSSLGLFGMRDKDKSCFRMFIDLFKATKKNQPLSSDEIAESLGLSRGTVVHHLNKLLASGIAVHEGQRYLLRVDTLEFLVEEIQKDLERTITDLKTVAKEIDMVMGK